MNFSYPISDEDLPRLRNYFYGTHTRYGLMFDIGLHTGLRISDILSIRVKQIKRTTFSVIEKKTGKKKKCVIPLALLRSITNFAKQLALSVDDYIVFSSNNIRSKPLSRSQAYKVISGAKKHLKIENLTPHSMRKTYAVKLYEKTQDINLVMRELNHSNISTTCLYVFLSIKHSSK